MCHATILVAILAFVPLASTAQETPTAQVPLQPGERVRVTGHLCQTFFSNCGGARPEHSVGTFVTWNADTLVMESNGDIIALPLDSVTTLEVSVGRKSHAGVGAGIGGLTGAVIGATVSLATCDGFFPPHVCALVGGFVFGAGGALVGVIVGASKKTERWVSVPLNRLRVSFGPLHDARFVVGMSVRF